MPRSELIRQIRPTDEILDANISGRVSLLDDSNRSAIEIELKANNGTKYDIGG